jgi:hypothetical protein
MQEPREFSSMTPSLACACSRDAFSMSSRRIIIVHDRRACIHMCVRVVPAAELPFNLLQRDAFIIFFLEKGIRINIPALYR